MLGIVCRVRTSENPESLGLREQLWWYSALDCSLRPQCCLGCKCVLDCPALVAGQQQQHLLNTWSDFSHHRIYKRQDVCNDRIYNNSAPLGAQHRRACYGGCAVVMAVLAQGQAHTRPATKLPQHIDFP